MKNWVKKSTAKVEILKEYANEDLHWLQSIVKPW